MGWVLNAMPRPLYTQVRPVIHCIGGWVGPTACLLKSQEPKIPPSFDMYLVINKCITALDL